MSVTLPMPCVTLLRRPAQSGWLQGVVTGIGFQRPVYSPTAALASLLNVISPRRV